MTTQTNTLIPRGPRSTQLLLATLLAAAAVAQDQTPLADAIAPRSAGFAQDFGVKDVRGQLRLYGKAGLEADLSEGLKFSVTGGAALDVRFLGGLREALALEVKQEAGLGSSKTRARSNAVASREEFDARAMASASNGPTKEVRICGFTLRLDRPTGDAKKNEKMAPKDLLPGGLKTTIMVGPVPMLLAANASVGLELGVERIVEAADATSGHSARFGLQGMVGASLNGWVIGGVGGGCRFASACAGVKADLKLMEVGTGLRLGYETGAGAFVDMAYKLCPATLKVLAIAYCEVGFGRFKLGKKFEYLLYQWSAPERKGTIPLIGN